MTKDCQITIERVANGYIVNAWKPGDDPWPKATDDVYVFNKLSHVFEFMERHFPGTLGAPETT